MPPRRASEVTLVRLASRLLCPHCQAVGAEGDAFCRWCGSELVKDARVGRVYHVRCACSPDIVHELDDDPNARPEGGARFCPKCGTGFAKALHEGVTHEGHEEPISILVGGAGR